MEILSIIILLITNTIFFIRCLKLEDIINLKNDEIVNLQLDLAKYDPDVVYNLFDEEE